MNNKKLLKKIGKTASFTRLMIEINKRICLSLYRKRTYIFEHGDININSSEWTVRYTTNQIIKNVKQTI